MSREDFEVLVRCAKALEVGSRGPKVYETADGRMVKLFRVKRRLSSNLLCPLALRFSRNAERLIRLGIPSVRVLQVAEVPHLNRQMAVYEKLPGTPVADLLRNAAADPAEILRRVGVFLARAHDSGVFFRCFHLGNILRAADGTFGLIDVLDTRFHSGPLRLRRRARNLCHVTHSPEERRTFAAHWPAFRKGYLEATTAGGSGLAATAVEEILAGHLRKIAQDGTSAAP